MKSRLILASICILTLPLWFSVSRSTDPMNPTPFGTVAYAGHTTAGEWCECGAQGCVCDPGERGGQSTSAPDQIKQSSDIGVSAIRTRSRFDLGTSVLMLALALLLWARLRA